MPLIAHKASQRRNRTSFWGLRLFFLLNVLSWYVFTATSYAGTFKARFTVDLCPEYKVGNSTLVLKYTIGNDPTVYRTTILKEVINSTKTSGTFDIELPADYRSTPIHVFAYCYNHAQRQGEISNLFNTSNCNRLMEVDHDKDLVRDGLEDLDCSNDFSPGDYSNLHNPDTDGDGVKDSEERSAQTDPANPGSSPRPIIFKPGSFDPDHNGNSNPVVWRPGTGTWFIRDYKESGNLLTFPFGQNGDIPFTYKPKNYYSNVGVIRIASNQYHWYFYGPGFRKSDGTNSHSITFGYWGDNIALGPWEFPGATNPAVVRLYNNVWEWDIYLSTGKIRRRVFGVLGDIPKFADYDGDGLFDRGVYRSAENTLYVVFSSDQSTHSYHFGTKTADKMFRGDVTGDGVDDITFWEPKTTLFSSMKSDSGFNDELAALKDSSYYQEETLGTYGETVPLSSFKIGNKVLYTVVNHTTGYRYYRYENSPAAILRRIQWGLPGDSQG